MERNLSRFVLAQDDVYTGYFSALNELKRGCKEGHWIWYIFPQLKQLGQSSKAQHYGIEGIEEAAAYFSHPVLGARLIEISQVLVDLEETNAVKILGHTDAMKVKSCMTLFLSVDPKNETFQSLIDKFYEGKLDARTIEILEREARNA